MRGLRRLIPQDLQDSLNANPIFQWIVVVLLGFVGLSFVFTGFNGVKNGRMRGKYGRVIEGTAAKFLGIVYILLGIIMSGLAVSMKLTS